MFKLHLGLEVKDVISGFRGIIIVRAEHITGCIQYGIVPKSNGTSYDGHVWIDESRLEVVGTGIKLIPRDKIDAV